MLVSEANETIDQLEENGKIESTPQAPEKSCARPADDETTDETATKRAVSRNPSRLQLLETASSKRCLVEASSSDKIWENLDSVHSRADEIRFVELANGSSSLNDSTCSFASFGDSDERVDAIASKVFTRLQEEPTPSFVLNKQQSMRLKRGMSFRRNSLTLIKELD